MTAISVELLLPAVGATVIATRSSLAEAVKVKAGLTRFYFLDCPLCLGFWVGALFSFVDGSRSPWQLFLMGCSVSVLSSLVSGVTDALQAYFAKATSRTPDGL